MKPDANPPPNGVAAIAALEQPLRRRLYALLTDRGEWTSRDQAAEALGLSRPVAAFHLDKLADAGVVEVSYERTSGRTGPGAGRPSKLYRPSAGELHASVPDRRYDLAGELLAEAVDRSARTASPVGECLHEASRAAGLEVGAAVSEARGGKGPCDVVRDVLVGYGYEPEGDLDGDGIVLGNCPFHRLAEAHRELVCGMNLDFLTGVVEAAAPEGEIVARLAPSPGRCCVRLDPGATAV